jgi:hypothetical protein
VTVSNKFGNWESYLGDIEFLDQNDKYILAVGYCDDLPNFIRFKVFKDGYSLYERYVIHGTLSGEDFMPHEMQKKCLNYVERLLKLKAFL